MICDLHCHTTTSDGLYTPAQLVRMAAKAGIDIIAVTDHDTVEGCDEAVATIKQEQLSLKLIKGVELSIDSADSGTVHLVGLGIDTDNKKLRERLEDFKEDREKRIYRTLAKLAELGYLLSIQDVLALTGEDVKSLGRPHVAAALVQKGYFKNVQDAFDRLLYTNGPAYIRHLKPKIKEAVKLIHDAGGLAIIAHPHTIKNEEIFEQLLQSGVDGLEAYYPEHTPEKLKEYKNIAFSRNLKISGGSDFHGIAGKYPPRLGVYTLAVQLLNLW